MPVSGTRESSFREIKFLFKKILHRRIMGGTNEHRSFFFLVGKEKIHKDSAVFIVKARCGFVGKDELRLSDDGSYESGPLLFSSGKFGRHPFSVTAEADFFKEIGRAHV